MLLTSADAWEDVRVAEEENGLVEAEARPASETCGLGFRVQGLGSAFVC